MTDKKLEMMWNLKEKCPHCGKESGRTWSTFGYVRCWECGKWSEYREWVVE